MKTIYIFGMRGGKNHAAERGITLYLAMIALSAALGTALFVSTIYVRELKISSGITASLQAVYVADSAAEYTLYQMRKIGTYDISAGTLTVSGFGTLSTNGQRVTIIPATSCAIALGTLHPSASCSAEGEVVAIGSVPGCSAASSAQNCTYVITKGTFGNAHRAMEIVYPNL